MRNAAEGVRNGDFILENALRKSETETMKTIFEKILDGEIPSEKIYEDDVCAAVRDINPQAPVHVLLFPRKPIASVDAIARDDSEIVAHLMLTVPKIAKSQGLEDGYRVVINNGALAGQTIEHLHLHILGGKRLGWPPC